MAAQLALIDTMGRAVNAGAHVPFNSVRLATFGMADRPATDDEVVRVVDVARRWRTNFPNHERVSPETATAPASGSPRRWRSADAPAWSR